LGWTNSNPAERDYVILTLKEICYEKAIPVPVSIPLNGMWGKGRIPSHRRVDFTSEIGVDKQQPR